MEAKATEAYEVAIAHAIEDVAMVTVKVGSWEAVVCGAIHGAMVIAVVIVLVVVLVPNDLESTAVLAALPEMEEPIWMASKTCETDGTATSNLSLNLKNLIVQTTCQVRQVTIVPVYY